MCWVDTLHTKNFGSLETGRAAEMVSRGGQNRLNVCREFIFLRGKPIKTNHEMTIVARNFARRGAFRLQRSEKNETETDILYID